MRFITTVALLAGALPAVNAQGWANQRVRVDVSAGLALPSAPKDFRIATNGGAELLVGVRYRVSPILYLHAYSEVISFRENVVCLLTSASTCQDKWSAPMLSLFAGPLVALSSASTHMYLQGAVGVIAPGDHFPPGARRAPAVEVGVGILHRLAPHLRGFEEITHTRGFEAYIHALPQEGLRLTTGGIAYSSLRIGVSLGPR
jgi:hypothetical protein